MLWLAQFIVGPAVLTLDLGGRRALTAASQLPLLHGFWLTRRASVAITVRGPFTIASSMTILFLLKARCEASPPGGPTSRSPYRTLHGPW
jgi:hypothetical protein